MDSQRLPTLILVTPKPPSAARQPAKGVAQAPENRVWPTFLSGARGRLAALSVVILTYGCDLPPFTLAGESTSSASVAVDADARPPLLLADGGHDAPSDGTLVPDASLESAAPRDAAAGGSGVLISGDLVFGAVACGKSALARVVLVKNGGGVPFTVAADLMNGLASPFEVRLSRVVVAPGEGAAITVTPKPIPPVSAVPGAYSDTLTVHTDLVGDYPHVIPISESAQGAILAFDTQAIPFGEVPVSSAQSSTFHVVNSGDLMAEVELASLPGDGGTSFAVTPSNGSVGSGDSLTANATFAPSTAGMAAGSVVLTVAPGTVLCGELPQGLALSGTGENGGLTVSENVLTFGPTTCGTTSKPQSITLTNSGNASLTWSAGPANTSASPYAVSPTTGSLAAGDSVSVVVTPGPIPAVSSVQQDFYADAVTFTTDVVGDQPHVVTLSQTASGAILAFNPDSLSFGDVPLRKTRAATVQVVNTGNTVAHVTLASTGDGFSISPTTATAVAPGAPASFSGTFAPGTTPGPATGTLSLTSTDPLCAPAPQALGMTGTGTVGVVGYSPGALAFGNQATSGFTACGTQAAPQQVTFTNGGNQSYTITPTLVGGAMSPFTVAMAPPTGVVAENGGAVVVTVTPAPIPATSAVPGTYSDSLSVTTTADGDGKPHLIPLTQNAYGAILAGVPSVVSFPGTPVGGQATSAIGITNDGNASATLVWTQISNAVFSFDQSVVAAAGGATTSPNAYFRPAAAAQYAATAAFGVGTGTILCQPLPETTVMLAGVGTSASTVTVSPPQVNFNMVPCGTSGGSQVVTITNAGVNAITWTASLPDGANFTLAPPATGMIAAGASATVTVNSSVVPMGPTTTTTANAFGSELTLTTDAPDDTPHSVPILETASGAILTFSPAALDLPAMQRGSPVAFQVQNAGNVTANVALTLTNPGPAALTLDMPEAGPVASGTPLQGAITESLTSAPSTNATVTLTPAMGTVLCQAAPPPMTLTAH
jgi:hypothetical protein